MTAQRANASVDISWLVNDLVDRVAHVHQAVVLSHDGILIAKSTGLSREEAEHLSAVASGMPATDDFNGADQLGAGRYQVTCKGGRRWSTAKAYLEPVAARPNLTVQTGALTTRPEARRSW